MSRITTTATERSAQAHLELPDQGGDAAGVVEERAWNIALACDTRKVPVDVLEAVRRHLEDMGPGLMLIGAEDPFWSSLRESGMSLTVDGWRFKFRVEHQGATCVEVAPSMRS